MVTEVGRVIEMVLTPSQKNPAKSQEAPVRNLFTGVRKFLDQ
jgi:hypothetical protein